jgi:hypothetical protein
MKFSRPLEQIFQLPRIYVCTMYQACACYMFTSYYGPSSRDWLVIWLCAQESLPPLILQAEHM